MPSTQYARTLSPKKHMHELKDRIWVTAKVRMIAEARYKRYDLISHLFLVYMSLLIILSSIFKNDMIDYVPHFDNLTIIVSVFIFTGTIIIYGFRFSDLARQHRECYLHLQDLERVYGNIQNPELRYSEILLRYPNHSQSDYDAFVIEKLLFSGQNLSIGGKSLTWDALMLFRYFFRSAMFYTTLLLPPTIITILFLPPAIRGSFP